ncbi:MAG: glycosyltransferase family 4 protein [Planctomycetia bacterium]|nr:glycosyltransferase family 4 protein [Planctomycetia bacterium]
MRLTLFLPHLAVTGGLGVHCRCLLDALLRTAHFDDRLTVLAPADPKQLFPNSGLDDGARPLLADPRVALVPVEWPADHPLSLSLDRPLASAVRNSRPDIVYASYYTGFADPPVPQVVTFHDAGFLDFPHVFGDTARQRRETLATVAPRIATLHCISADARERICRLLPFDPAKTAVVWHGLADSPQDLATARNPSNEPLWSEGDRIAEWGDYLFSPVGAATGFNRVRKNLPIAIEAFRRLEGTHPRVKLIVASTGVLNERMLGELLPAREWAGGGIVAGAWRSADDRIRVLPNLDRAPFLRAMAHARAVVYPSRYEGFGFPAIEAMALGVPLLASRATSIPEVAGDAGLLVNPDRSDEFHDGMRELLSNESLREDLIRRGRDRVMHFTLERMGQGMWNLFRQVLE